MTAIQTSTGISAIARPAAAAMQSSSGSGASAYTAGWGARPAIPRQNPAIPVAAQSAGGVQGRPASPATVHERALLAADVYQDTATPPAGYRVATTDEVRALGIDPARLDSGRDGFRARIYAADAGGYVVAFRGSEGRADWETNARQGIGLSSDHYARALKIGRDIAASGADVAMTGHSLGGGLASAASIASGTPATTFNAAGLHDRTIGQALGIARTAGAHAAPVDNYRVRGEVLTLVQEGGDRVLGGILTGPVSPAIGSALLDLPEAYGRQHQLPDVAPAGTSFLDRLNIVDRHGMDWVIAGTAARLR